MIKNLHIYRTGFLLKAILFLGLFLALGSGNVFAQFAITEDFRNNGNPDIIIGGPGGTEGAAYLTSGVNDPVGSGFLRLTNSDTYQKGFAYVNKSFPSTMGVLVDFEYKMWRDVNDDFDGADGIGVFLYNAASTFQLGGYGGSLGYAPGGGSTTGLAGGYVGIGLDAYGNYSAPTEGRIGGPGETPNAVVLRGVTTAAAGTTNAYLAGAALGTRTGDAAAIRARNEIDYNTQTATRPTDATFYRRVQIEVVRLDAAGIYYNVIVRWKKSPTAAFVYVTDYTTTDVPPALLKLGFAASSGGGVNYHEIRNLLVTTPGNLRVLKRADKDILRTNTAANGTITYSIEVTNATAFELSDVQFYDKITDSYGDDIAEGTSGFDITSITATGFVSASLPTVSTLTTNEITGSLVIGAGQTGVITVTGRLYAIPPGNILQNTARVDYPLDEDLNNNISIVRTPVISENVDILLTKTVTEQCITSGTPPKFTVYASNVGAVATSYRRLGINGTRIAIYNVVPTGYTYDDSSTPGGFAGIPTDAQNSNVTARWSRLVLANTPSAGYTTYRYIARGTSTSGAAGSLASGMTYPYPVTYTMTPPVSTTNYTDVSTAMLFTDLNYTTSIEPPENQLNNNVGIDMTVKPLAPVVPAGTIYYCVDETAVVLTATATGTNTLRWYMTATGFSSEYPIKPLTETAGTFTYYVSQVNGDCESPKTPITVSVGPTNAGTISANGSTCPNSSIFINGTGVATATYRWESSADGATWTIISGATGEDYTSGNLTATTYFRRLTRVTANGKDCEGPTNYVIVYMPEPGFIGNSQYECSNFNPDAFTNVENGTTGTINGVAFNYQWQISNNGSTGWADIDDADNATYNQGNITATRYFRRGIKYTVGGNTCYVYSNIVVAYKGSNNNNPDGGSISVTPGTICYNTIPNSIISTDNGDTGVYIWEYSTNGGGLYSPILDANPASSSYTPTAPLTQTTIYSRRVNAGCDTSSRKTATVTVSQPTAGSIGTSHTICYGATPNALTSTAGAGGTTYRWESADGTTGGTWTNTGITTATFIPPALTASRRYRRINVNTTSGCESVASNVVIITVKQQATAGVITGAQNICNGGSIATITGTQATSDDAIAYTWQVSSTLAGTYTTAAGSATVVSQQNYTPTVSGYYRRRATTGCGTYDTNIVLVTVQATISPGTLGANQTICYNTIPAQITGIVVNPVGTAAITYRWESSANVGGPFTTAAGTSNGQNYTAPVALTATTYYRRIVISTLNGNVCESAAPTPVTITILAAPTAGAIATNQNICNGATPALLTSTTGGTGTGTISYAWQSSTDGGATWSIDIATATAATYQPPALTTTTLYKRFTVTTNGAVVCRSVETTPVTITVSAVTSAGAIGSNQNICNGGTPALLTSATAGTGTGTIAYAWQSSTDGGATWSIDIATATGATYQPPALTATTLYKRFTIATNGTAVCRSAAATTAVTITVSAVTSAGAIGSNQNICNGGTPALLTSATAGTGTGTITYAWQSSTDGGATWSIDIATATGATYQPPALTATTLYKRFTIATNGTAVCRSAAATTAVTITVSAMPTAGAIGSDQNICNGGIPALLTSGTAGTTGGTGTLSYKWQLSVNSGSSWSDIPSATAATYQPGALTATTLYHRITVTTNGLAVCESAATTAVTVTVSAATTAGSLTANQSICVDTVPALIGPGTIGTGSGTITYRWEKSANGTTGWTTIPGATLASYQPPVIHATTYYRRITIAASTVGSNTATCESSVTPTVIVTAKNCKVITNPMIYQRVN